MAHITQQDFALAAEDLVFHAMHKINQAADQENDRLDEQIKKLDNMGRDELEELRERRLMAMKQKQEALLKLKAQGHGQYRFRVCVWLCCCGHLPYYLQGDP
jgi:hypothetical protein